MSQPKRVLIPAWENSPTFRKLSEEEKAEFTRKLLYVQEHRYGIPDLLEFAAGYTGHTKSAALKAAQGGRFNLPLLNMLYQLTSDFIETGRPLRDLRKEPELVGVELNRFYWGDDDEY